MRATPGVASVTPVVVSRDRQAAMLIAYPATGEQDPATSALVQRISGTVLPRTTAGTGIRAYATGPNAANVTFSEVIGQRLPLLVGVLSMMLLLVVFRSVTVAIKASIMNLLSISTAYGVLVMVTQHGWLRQLFGFPETMPVTTWVPVFLFVILFGLSMDYEVFLLSRIREAYDATGDNAASVASGLASTARVISPPQRSWWWCSCRSCSAPTWLPGPLDRILPKTFLREDEPMARARVAVSAGD